MREQVEIDISYLSKEEIIKRFLELEKENQSLHQRILNQCELLKKLDQYNHMLFKINKCLQLIVLPLDDFMNIDFTKGNACCRCNNYRLQKIEEIMKGY